MAPTSSTSSSPRRPSVERLVELGRIGERPDGEDVAFLRPSWQSPAAPSGRW